jgi:hypothetical protein
VNSGYGLSEAVGFEYTLYAAKVDDMMFGGCFPQNTMYPKGRFWRVPSKIKQKPREIMRNQDFSPSGDTPTGAFCQEEYEPQEGFAKNEGDADPGPALKLFWGPWIGFFRPAFLFLHAEARDVSVVPGEPVKIPVACYSPGRGSRAAALQWVRPFSSHVSPIARCPPCQPPHVPQGERPITHPRGHWAFFWARKYTGDLTAFSQVWSSNLP